MARSSIVRFKTLVNRINALERTRKRVERRYSKGSLARLDVELLYKGLYIEIMTEFENFLEDMFIGLLVKSIKHVRRDVKSNFKFKDKKECRLLLMGDQRYVSWLPYENEVLKRAGRHFKDSKPFSHLSRSEITKLSKYTTIRNAIAHNSIYSTERFRDKVLSQVRLPPKQRNPVGYLRSINTIRNGVPITHFEEVSSNLKHLGRLISH